MNYVMKIIKQTICYFTENTPTQFYFLLFMFNSIYILLFLKMKWPATIILLEV